MSEVEADKKKDVQPSRLHWLVLSCIVIVCSSVGYWLFKTEQSLDEFITALSWSSIICIVVGGLMSFGAGLSANLAKLRRNAIAERRDAIEQSKAAKPAAFGIIAAGILFLLITVAIEWAAKQLS